MQRRSECIPPGKRRSCVSHFRNDFRVNACLNKVDKYGNQQQAKTWHHAHMKQEIHEKTIGSSVSEKSERKQIAKSFGITVLGRRHSGKSEEFVDEMFTQKQWNDLLPRCDYIVVILPFTPEMRNMFGKIEFKLIKLTAFFINIGRRNRVIQNELVHVLMDKDMRVLDVDVFETEPLP
ncbi:NAD(P)-dependent oxidoreductase [Peribacillus simplex]|uniref:Glyoxylate/hydroxypyruvate reductase B n=1 Tax=Peribacillus simplex TaxID=1478 RepID=A0A9W4L9F7_9BACI|nr:NAD(P)-dependent oxidoreductase [Peribacillus simplex]CAH0292211.1 Glyoxylate/hydroxypyruvate reductase B [Peribacillus simplex]